MTTSEKKGFFGTQGGLIPQEEKIINPFKIGRKKVILIAGPTAAGKSHLAMMVAKNLKGEIITADSAQVYKGMDIGTAKPSQEDQTLIPHHLIDIRHVQESFNVVDFYYEARKTCEAILARNHVPIVVGGTGFYFRALIHGPPTGPPSMPDIRKELEEEMDLLGFEAMFEKLKSFDPQYAATITSNDKHKIIRALEIITITGEKVSKFSWNREKIVSEFQFYPWFLYRPREVLYPRIEKRCEEMLEAGLIDEVKNLIKQGIKTNTSASQAIGYRQILKFLQTSQTPEDYQTMVNDFKKASRHYAKRQFTWFRKEPLFRWLNVDVHDYEIAADMIIQDYLST